MSITSQPKVYYVSQSEVDSRLSCQRKHYYAFGFTHPSEDDTVGLQPTHHSDSLTRGTIGHKVLEDYYQAIKDGHSRQSAMLTARDAHIKAMGENPHQAEMYSETLQFFLNYHEFYMDEEYEPLILEYNFEYQIHEELIFPFKPDAIFKHKPTGKIYVVDHKFLYRFYQDRVFPILPQLLRYAYALRQMGYQVDGYIYNMVSTDKRAQPQNRFKRHKVEFTKAHDRKMVKVFGEMLETMEEIVAAKKDELWEAKVKRNMSSFSCANCPFLELCTAELEGQPGIGLLVKQFYESNKYGYGKDKEEADV
mgnify:CR=1 FL=1